MAASTVAIQGKYRPSHGKNRRLKMAAELIPFGAIVMINAAGYVANATDTAGCKTLGVALETVDNSGGSPGDLEINVDIGGAEVQVAHEVGSLTIANVGDAVVLELNNEVSDVATSTNDIAAGAIIEVVDATTIWVALPQYA